MMLVVRSGAVRRMVAERESPRRGRLRPRPRDEHLLQPGPVLVVVEAVLALLLTPGRVDAHQVDERADRGSVEQSRLHGGVTAAETPGAEAGLEVEVVGELRPVVGASSSEPSWFPAAGYTGRWSMRKR